MLYDVFMKTLEKLFSTAARVKIMRLFLFNPDTAYAAETVITRTREQASLVRKELSILSSMGLIKKRNAYVIVKPKSDKNKKALVQKKKVSGWVLDKEFGYLNELRNLLINTQLARSSDIIRRLQKSGKMKLIILAGIFIQNTDSRLDLLVVGDDIRKASLENAVKTLESEIGKELKYIWLDTEEFNYRVSMYDKLVRDVLDFPHEKILNRLAMAS